MPSPHYITHSAAAENKTKKRLSKSLFGSMRKFLEKNVIFAKDKIVLFC